ncbi:hypothetical protein B5S28_g2382 [[Candida] boidinii]|nr:hypothetical protein B5S28_g2382 [[Candida] boidinii]
MQLSFASSLAILAGLIASTDAAPAFHKHHEHVKRSQTCSFPSDDSIVAVTPKGKNAGWALHADTACTPGMWCPYACAPGQLMAQWDPSVTSYSYPGSQYGGLHCNDDGTLSKGFQDKPLCYDGKGTASVFNNAAKDVAICQTVLPGNEEMLIPTVVDASNTEKIAVPGTKYWAQTASHFYVNPPGVSAEEGCVWGSKDNSTPMGNWSPYVIGANMDDQDNTYVKIGWNPVYFENTSPYKNEKPSFGIKMYCNDESKCNGNPCEINPSTQGLNKVSGSDSVSDGAAWCVLTATDKNAVTIEVFDC